MGHFSIQEISRQITSKERSIEEISKLLPCYIHINSLTDFSILESDSRIQRYFDLDIAEINARGFEFLKEIIDKDDLVNAVNTNMDYLKKKEDLTHVGFFQRINFPGLKDQQLYYTRGKIIDDERILNLSIPIQDIKLFNVSVFDICENTHRVKKGVHLFNQLTKAEIRVIKALIDGGSIHEIALRLNSSRHTIKNHKTNIYKKLNVKNYFEFYHFIKDFKVYL